MLSKWTQTHNRTHNVGDQNSNGSGKWHMRVSRSDSVRKTCDFIVT
jgi:hypothetical protein